jgi:hypothetical protein
MERLQRKITVLEKALKGRTEQMHNAEVETRVLRSQLIRTRWKMAGNYCLDEAKHAFVTEKLAVALNVPVSEPGFVSPTQCSYMLAAILVSTEVVGQAFHLDLRFKPLSWVVTKTAALVKKIAGSEPSKPSVPKHFYPPEVSFSTVVTVGVDPAPVCVATPPPVLF